MSLIPAVCSKPRPAQSPESPWIGLTAWVGASPPRQGQRTIGSRKSPEKTIVELDLVLLEEEPVLILERMIDVMRFLIPDVFTDSLHSGE